MGFKMQLRSEWNIELRENNKTPTPLIMNGSESKMTSEGTLVEINNSQNNLSPGPYDMRESLLTQLHEAIVEIHKKAMTGRITKPENEKVRIQWFKALAYSCSIYNQIQKDVEMDELKEEVETLKKQIEQINNGQMGE